MAGLVPAIHVFVVLLKSKTWMPGTGLGVRRYPSRSPSAVKPNSRCTR